MKTALIVVALALCASVAHGWNPWHRKNEDEDAASKVHFELYTQASPNDPEVLAVADLPTPFVNFDPSRPTKIIVHGWHGANARTRMVTDAFLSTMNVNAIILNWHAIDTLVYPVAAHRVKVISKQLAILVEHLVDAQGLDPADLHIVGHSLGAHISGLSATHLRSDIIISRITGLDPAGPLIGDGPQNRLDKSHAAFVDVIHTCVNVFGYRHPIGHVDYYPNGGTCIQPGCTVQDLTTGKCSHNRAYYLFTESILLHDSFQAYPASETEDDKERCADMDTEAEPVLMGLSAPQSARGVYCLATRRESPFGYGTMVAVPIAQNPNPMLTAVMKFLLYVRNRSP